VQAVELPAALALLLAAHLMARDKGIAKA
jgi:hypothetical protein